MALRQHLARLTLLVGLAAVVQAWVIAHAVVPAQDAVRYLAGAQTMQRDGWWPAVLAADDPPLFPALVCGAYQLRQSVISFGDTESERLGWLSSLQFAAAALVVLSVVPLYGSLARWVGSPAAFFGSLLFCVLPSVARLGADGLSDSLQLFAALTAWCGLTIFLTNDSHSRRAFCLAALTVAGFALGCGMLAGSITQALLPAFAIAVSIDQLRNESQRRFGHRALPAVAVWSSVAMIVAPYLVATAGWDAQRIFSRWRGEHRPQTAALLNFSAATLRAGQQPNPAPQENINSWRLSSGEPMAFGHKEASVSLRSRGIFAALLQFVTEFTRVAGAPLLVLAAIGVWQAAPSRWGSRVDRCLLYLTCCYALIAIVHTARSGYLSERHLLPLLPLLLAWAGRGVVACGLLIERQLPWAEAWADAWPRVPAAAWFSRCTVLGAATICLAIAARPLHASRWEHRQAAEWLAVRATESQAVLDTRGWTAFFSGRPTYRHEAAAAALTNPQLAYVVVEQRELNVDSPRSRTLRELLARSADRVMSFSAPTKSANEGVIIYRWHPERFAMQTSTPDTDRK